MLIMKKKKKKKKNYDNVYGNSIYNIRFLYLKKCISISLPTKL